MPRRSRKLVVVSNRGPLRRESSGGRRRWARAAGGLVAALDPVLRVRGGVWVSAKQAKDFDTVSVDGPRLEYQLAQVQLKRSIQEGFYEGVSNAVLWPLLHSFPPTIRAGEAPWKSYVEANRAFADVVLESSAPGDLVWIHDYHLTLLPLMLRRERRRSRIGWFCHVPWPPAHVFGTLPWRGELLDGILGADVVGFHTDEYVDGFLECVERFTTHAVDHAARTVTCGARRVQVMSAPIGIPVSDLQTLASDPDVAAEVDRIRQTIGHRKMILGVDRLDYTKGIPERLLAFDQLLSADRSAHARFVYVQVMVPSRTDVRAYAELKQQIDSMVGDVNGRHSSTGRIPIHYLYRNLSQRALFAHYRAADVALVTPLRDGMNLVAHEYVASRVNEDGVLILSEFAGSARYLEEALVVNPYDIAVVASTIVDAFEMKPSEARRRMRSLRGVVEQLDVHRWADACLEALEA